MKRIILVISSLFAFSLIFAQQTKILTAEKHNEYGLIYTLPTTAFKIEVVVSKEIQQAGPFAKYSKIFTSDARPILKDEVNWNIESVKVIPYGVPDSENRYLMQLKAGATTFLSVSEDGMLLAINKEVFPEVVESEETSSLLGTPYTGKEYLEFVNEDFIAAQSSYKQAQILAEELMEVRDAKISLTRGTADSMPTDGKQLELMLASLEQQEKALMNAFTGSSWKELSMRTYTFIPEEEGKYILCKLSNEEGLIDPNAKTGIPVYLNVKVTEEAQLPVDSKGEEKKLPKDAVIYCVPGYASLTASFNNKTLYQKELPMSQFGLKFGLNPSIFTDKKEPSYAEFDPATGALLELGVVK